jgi:hypothetical protein
MSDSSQGPNWWQASDGKWYAAELHPQYLGAESQPPSPALSISVPQPTASPSTVQAYDPAMQTPGLGLPGGGAWAAPQQVAIANVSKSPGLAIAALILGIGAFFFSLIPLVGFASIPFAICGLALGITAFKRASKGYEGKGMAIIGIVGCTAALLISVAYIFILSFAASHSPDCGAVHFDGVPVSSPLGTCYSPSVGYYTP